jgi:hypothetical protein
MTADLGLAPMRRVGLAAGPGIDAKAIVDRQTPTGSAG